MSMTHSGMLYRLDISTFYFYETLLLHIFVLWKLIKTLPCPCLLSYLQSTATQPTISINIFVSFKYYTVLSQFFQLKYTFRLFTLNCELNVKHHSDCFLIKTMFYIKNSLWKKEFPSVECVKITKLHNVHHGVPCNLSR